MFQVKRRPRQTPDCLGVAALLRGVAVMCLMLLCSACGKLAIEDDRAELDMQKVQVGDAVTIVIPTDQLFYPKTANFKPQAFDMLESLTAYLNAHQVHRFKMKGYLDNMGDEGLNVMVSTKQVEQLSGYLWKHLDYIVWEKFEGLGSINPLTSKQEGIRNGRNRRITIAYTEASHP